ncbi:MAG: glycosyltransferase family 2 protein [Pseudobdellovibrio sp.]
MNESYAIAILSYNHPEITARCVNSVLQLHSSKDIFLVHNGSENKFVNQLVQMFPNIHHIKQNINNGYSGGVNFTLKHVFQYYEQVLFLTNDIELETINPNPHYDFAAIKIFKRNTTSIDSLMGELDPRLGRLNHLKTLKDIKNQNYLYIPGTAFWINKQTFKTVGLFDESFHTYWEDVDYSFRARLHNIKLSLDEQTTCKHKIGKTCHKNRFYTYELYQRNRGLFMKKHQLIGIQFLIQYTIDLFKYCRSDYGYVFLTLKNLYTSTTQIKGYAHE